MVLSAVARIAISHGLMSADLTLLGTIKAIGSRTEKRLARASDRNEVPLPQWI